MYSRFACRPYENRRSDIPLLVRHFVKKLSRRMDKRIDTIPSETMQALVNWHWPGNIRELENLIERSVILSDGPVLKTQLPEQHSRTRVDCNGGYQLGKRGTRTHHSGAARMWRPGFGFEGSSAATGPEADDAAIEDGKTEDR